VKQYVFGYGSLVSPRQVAVTLGRQVDLIYPVELRDWVRDWSIVLENSSSPRCYELADGTVPENVACLTIRRPLKNEKATNPNGVLIEVTEEDILRLDDRERHYDRVDVTGQINGEHEGRVFTYVSRPQYSRMLSDFDDVILPGSYSEVVEQAFQDLGDDMYKNYVQSTLQPALPLHETVFVNRAIIAK
jgi:hypothetical protein